MNEDLHHILDHTETLWKSLRGERLFITGGTGFFGRWFLESLYAANERFDTKISAHVLTRDATSFRLSSPLAHDPALTLLQGDLVNFDFPDGEFSHVLHMGTTTSLETFHHVSPLAVFDNIVLGTRRVLDFAIWCRAQRFLLTSSGAVYGHQPITVTHIAEDQNSAPSPTNTTAAVGNAKRMAEGLAVTYGEQYGLHVTIARCFSFIGKHLPLDLHYAVGNFLRDALNGGPIHVRGDGSSIRSYLYAPDLMIWLLTILCQGTPGRAYNVGSEESVSILDLALRVAGRAGRPGDVYVHSKVPPRFLRPDRYVPSTERARRELGLNQLIGLDDAITRTLKELA